MKSNSDMSEETLPHVPPMLLWGYTCGHTDLIGDQFEHLSNCAACQSLVCQIMEVLEEIAATHRKKVA